MVFKNNHRTDTRDGGERTGRNAHPARPDGSRREPSLRMIPNALPAQIPAAVDALPAVPSRASNPFPPRIRRKSSALSMGVISKKYLIKYAILILKKIRERDIFTLWNRPLFSYATPRRSSIGAPSELAQALLLVPCVQCAHRETETRANQALIASHTSCADIPHSPASRSIFSYRVAKPDSAARESGASSMRAHSLPVLFPRSKRTYLCFRPSYAFCAMPPSCLFHTQLNWVLSSAEPTACQLAKREARENALRSRTQPSSSHTSRIAPASEESPKLDAHCDMLKTDRNRRAKRWSLFCSICPLA